MFMLQVGKDNAFRGALTRRLVRVGWAKILILGSPSSNIVVWFISGVFAVGW